MTDQRGVPSLADVATDNIRAYRVLRRLSQDQLARRVQQFGAPSFSRQALSEVERGRRNVGLEELVGLAAALEATVADLLDPYGPERRGRQIALGSQLLSTEQAHLWVRDRVVARVVPLPDVLGSPVMNQVRFEPQLAETPEMAKGALRAITEHYQRGSVQHDSDADYENGDQS